MPLFLMHACMAATQTNTLGNNGKSISAAHQSLISPMQLPMT